MPGNSRRKITKRALKNAIEQNADGSVSTVSRYLNIARSTFYRYLDSWPEIREIWEDKRQGSIDELESTAFTLAKEGNASLLMFLLSRLGRNRGYSDEENKTISHLPITLNVMNEQELN